MPAMPQWHDLFFVLQNSTPVPVSGDVTAAKAADLEGKLSVLSQETKELKVDA